MFITHKNTKIYYTDDGKGEPVVMLHGFLENSKMWSPFIPDLTKKNRIICIDLLGHGKTECSGYIHTMEQMAEIVEAVLNYLSVKKSYFIGHSMGGYVALAFAEKNENALKGLCLMNSTALDDSLEKKQNRNRTIAFVKKNYNTFIRIAINNLFIPKNKILFSEKIDDVINNALNTPLQGVIAALEGMKIRKNRVHILSLSNFKKMMIIGKKDPVLNYSSLISQLENTNVKKAEFTGGHMSHIENKADFLSSIVRFIENN